MDGPEDIALSEDWGGGSTRHRRWKFRGGFSSASSHNNNSQHSKPQYAWTSNPHQRGVGVSLLISTFVLTVAITRLIIHGYGTRPMQPNLRKNDGSAAQLKLKVVPEENILNESQQMNELQKGKENGGSNSIEITKANYFPPGCYWECYIDNYPDLSEALPRTEKAALAHYVEGSAKNGRDCKCKVMPKKDGRVTPPPAKEMRENDGSSFKALKGTDLKKIQVDKVIPKKDESATPPPAKEMIGNDGNSVKALKSTDVKKIQVNGDDKGRSNSLKITNNSINLFPRGCHWECYLDNHPDLSKALPRTEEAANAHYVESGANEGRDCRC